MALLPPSNQALNRSEVYLFLARAFMYPQEALDSLHKRACAAWAELEASALARLEALKPPAPERLTELYVATFTHTTPAQAPPYETEYGREYIFRQPQAFAELAALYRTFGLQPAAGERLDHIGTQLEFMYYLCYKEAFAQLSANPEGAQRCQEGQRHFVEHNLGRWAPLFLEQMSRHGEGFYAQLASLTGTWVVQEIGRLGARPSLLGEEDLFAAQRLGQFFDGLDRIAACEDGP